METGELQEFGRAQFEDAYKRALQRKQLFKEYLSRHQVMEKLNAAVEKLYESDRLPENPMDFIAQEIAPAAGSKAKGKP